MEWHGKYASAPTVFTAPMVDAPVLLALGRTFVELLLVPVPLGAFALYTAGPWALVVPVLAFFAMPRVRHALSQNRALHWCWGRGLRAPSQLLARFVRGPGTPVPSPFTPTSRLVRLRP